MRASRQICLVIISRGSDMPDAIRGSVVINEIHAQPVAGTAAVDLGGLQLWDPGSRNWFAFPAGSVPGPGGPAFDAGRASAVLSNAGDNIHVYDPAANQFVAAAYGNWPLTNPTNSASWAAPPGTISGLTGFPAHATQIGAGEHFGAIVAGDSIQRLPSGSGTFVNDDGESPGTAKFWSPQSG